MLSFPCLPLRHPWYIWVLNATLRHLRNHLAKIVRVLMAVMMPAVTSHSEEQLIELNVAGSVTVTPHIFLDCPIPRANWVPRRFNSRQV